MAKAQVVAPTIPAGTKAKNATSGAKYRVTKNRPAKIPKVTNVPRVPKHLLVKLVVTSSKLAKFIPPLERLRMEIKCKVLDCCTYAALNALISASPDYLRIYLDNRDRFLTQAVLNKLVEDSKSI